jgi:transcriptional regulator with XRE-family HTH domain
MNKEYERFIYLLKMYRKTSGKTQKDIANELGTTQSFVSKYENNQRRLDLIETMNIIEIIGIDKIKFLKELEKGIK